MDEKKEQNVLLYSRQRLEITGVCDVCEFSETSLELTLADCFLGIDGEQLKIDYFNGETGKVCIHGNVSGICYYGKPMLSKKNKKHRS